MFLLPILAIELCLFHLQENIIFNSHTLMESNTDLNVFYWNIHKKNIFRG